MKFELELPVLPEGVKPLRFGYAMKGEYCVTPGGGFRLSRYEAQYSGIIVELSEGYEAVSVNGSHVFEIRRKPRKRLCIELYLGEHPEGLMDMFREVPDRKSFLLGCEVAKVSILPGEDK